MEKPQVVKVFFPQCLLNSKSGLCLGVKDRHTGSVCILAIMHISGTECIPGTDELPVSSGTKLSIIGTFINRTTPSQDSIEPRPDAIIILEQQIYNGIPDCHVVQSPWQQHGNGLHTFPLFILFDEQQVMKMRCNNGGSCHIGGPQESGNGKCHAKQHKAISSKELHSGSSFQELDFVTSSVQQFCELSPAKVETQESILCTSVRTVGGSGGMELMIGLCRLCIAVPLFAMKAFLHCLLYISRMRLCTNSIVHKVLTYPASGAQLASKASQVCGLVGEKTGNRSETVSSSKNSSKVEFMRTGNVISSVVVDLLLGLLLLVWMYETGSPPLLAETIATWADQTGLALQHLLHWLMGAPAGLKLNTSLAHFLGNFFLYHIYLWIGYLNVLLPMMTLLLWAIAGAGILGLSVQLALASDLLSLLTFHIYCFYVYAARIYSLQVSALLSLARLFQGKKWNVLRQRVDHCSYDVDQLFMGTLLFTMLFFMLPTTALFYVVFTLLRLAILILQSLLTLVRDFLQSFSWFSLCLWLSKSDLMNAGVEFQVIDQSPRQPCALILQMQRMPIAEALKFGRPHPPSPVPDKEVTFAGICKKLVRGHLIYPWGGEKRS